MRPAPDRRRTWVLRRVVASLAVAGLAVVGLSVRGGSPADEPAPADVDSIEWQTDDPVIDEPLVDVFDLAEIHASSRLQYDECQQDYAAVSSASSSSRNPQYFC